MRTSDKAIERGIRRGVADAMRGWDARNSEMYSRSQLENFGKNWAKRKLSKSQAEAEAGNWDLDSSQKAIAMRVYNDLIEHDNL